VQCTQSVIPGGAGTDTPECADRLGVDVPGTDQ
jgi:hypothetical protein